MSFELRRKVVSAAAVLASLFAGSVSADWYNGTTIEYLYSGSAGNRTAISLVGGNPNADPVICQSVDNLVLETGHADFKYLWSIVLSAYLQERAIDVYIKGCDPLLGYPIVTDVRLSN